MGKQNQINIISVFTWLSNVIDTVPLSMAQQVVLLHLVKLLNRNFWKAIDFSPYMLSRLMGQRDSRTVKNALKALIEKNLIIQKDGEIHLAIDGTEKLFSKRPSANHGDNQPDTIPAQNASNAEFKPESNSKVKTLADLF